MSRTALWLCAVSSVVLLTSGCNCNNIAVDFDAGSGGGSAAGGSGTGGGSTNGGGAATGGNGMTGGGADMNGGGTAMTGGSGNTGGGTGMGGGGMTGGGTGMTGGSGMTGGGTGVGGGAGMMGGGANGGGMTGGGTAMTGGGTGMTGGGANGGGMTGGGTGMAGGGMGVGGGAGTGGGSGMTCTGPATGTYVCQTCLDAADTNTGTQSCPLLTVNQGITNATNLKLPTVFIASSFNGGAAATYAESVVIPDGVVVQGRWVVMGMPGAFNWNRAVNAPTARTVIQDTTAEGLLFAPGATATAGIDGVTVISARLSTPAMVQLGVSVISASPTLLDFNVQGVPPGSPLPATAIGVAVSGAVSARPSPNILGELLGPQSPSSIGGIHGTAGAVGLQIQNAKAAITNVNITEVSSNTGTAVGTQLSNAPGTTFTGGVSNALSGVVCFGILSSGDATGTVVDSVSASGCNSISGGNISTQVSVGVAFDQCPAGTLGNPVVKNANRIAGGVVGALPDGGSGLAAGVLSSDGCALTVANNASITGAQTGSASTATGYGVICTYQGLTNKNGADAPCQITSNTFISGANALILASAGIACTGSCGTKNSQCSGSCLNITDNKVPAMAPLNAGVSGGAGSWQYGLYVEESSPTVARNSFGPIAAPTQLQRCSFSWGGYLRGAGGSYANNVFVAQNCTANGGASTGLELQAEQRADGSIASPLVHSNTIMSILNSTGSPLMINAQTQAGVRLSPLVGTGMSVSTGTFVNNIFEIGPMGNPNASWAFQEGSKTVNPKAVQFNDYVLVGSLITLNPPLYLDDGMTTLSLPSDIDLQTDTFAGNSVSIDPGLGALPPHLPLTSQVRSKGTVLGMQPPFNDYDGNPRPRADGGVDIGADQTVP
jgi:hypothetical protein